MIASPAAFCGPLRPCRGHVLVIRSGGFPQHAAMAGRAFARSKPNFSRMFFEPF